MSQFYLEREDDILKLCRQGRKEKIFIDFNDGKFLFRLKTLSKTQPLFKAVGIRRDLKILDATAGLGKDAASFVHFGAIVTAIEENDMVFALLDDGIARAMQIDKLKNIFDGHFSCVHGSSIAFMKNIAERQRPDVIYLDPMYPEAEKSAKPKKEMLFLRELLKPSTKSDLEKLLEVSLNTAYERVVIKRPVDSDFLVKKPTHSFESKLVRFDMYKI